MNTQDIEAQARKEIAAEEHRRAVDAAKVLIRERMARPWRSRLLPFTIEIKWRD